MGGNFLLKLNIDSRPIANKYREGKVKRTLKRELKVPETVRREANEAVLVRLGLGSSVPQGPFGGDLCFLVFVIALGVWNCGFRFLRVRRLALP